MEQVYAEYLEQKKILLDRLNSWRLSHNESFKDLERGTGISDSTLSKWYSGKGEISHYGLSCIARHYDFVTLHDFFEAIFLDVSQGDKRPDVDIMLASVAASGAAEASQAQHFETLLAHQKELRQLEADTHAQLMRQQQEHHAKVVAYLKQQVSRFRLTAIIFCVLFICGIIYNTFISAVDLPQLGAGGSIVRNGDVALGFLRIITIPLLIGLLSLVAYLLVSNRKRRSPSAK